MPHRACHERHDLVATGGVDQRAELHALLEPRSHAQRAHGLGESPSELLRDAALHQESVGSRAGLATVAHLRHHCAGHGALQVGVVEHDEGGVATQLHRAVHDAIGCLTQQAAPDLGGPREGELPHPGVVQHRGHHRSRAARWQHVHDPRRNAGLHQERPHCKRGQRRIRGGLEHDRASGRKRRADLAGRHRGGEVPRRDQDAHPDRLAQHEDSVGPCRRRLHVALGTHRLFGVPAKELRGVGDFATRVGERLAVLPDDQPREVLRALGHELEGAAEEFGALPGWGGGPGGEGGGCGAHRREPVLNRRAGDDGDHLAGGGVLDIKGLVVGRVRPTARDQQLRRGAD